MHLKKERLAIKVRRGGGEGRGGINGGGLENSSKLNKRGGVAKFLKIS